MEAFRTQTNVILLLLDEEEAEMLVTVAGDATSELNTALAAGQCGDVDGRVLDFVADLNRELKKALTRR